MPLEAVVRVVAGGGRLAFLSAVMVVHRAVRVALSAQKVVMVKGTGMAEEGTETVVGMETVEGTVEGTATAGRDAADEASEPAAAAWVLIGAWAVVGESAAAGTEAMGLAVGNEAMGLAARAQQMVAMTAAAGEG